jgi:hypothetical protein
MLFEIVTVVRATFSSLATLERLRASCPRTKEPSRSIVGA